MMEEKVIRDEEMNDALFNELLIRGDVKEFRDEFLSHHPYDQASFYEKADSATRQVLYQYLSPKEMADLFEAIEVDDDDYEDLFREMDARYAADLLSYMYTYHAVEDRKSVV